LSLSAQDLERIRELAESWPVGAHRAAEVDLSVAQAMNPHNVPWIEGPPQPTRAPDVVCNSAYHSAAVEIAGEVKKHILLLLEELAAGVAGERCDERELGEAGA